MDRMKGISYWKSLLIAVVLAVGGWAVFSLTKLGVEQLLLNYGIDSEVTQYSIIIVAVILILMLAGYGVKSALEKIVK